MTLALLVPWRAGCAHRGEVWRHLRRRWESEHPHAEIVEGRCHDGTWRKGAAIIDAALRTDADVVAMVDADVHCDLAEAIAEAEAGRWAIPHGNVVRLTESATRTILDGGQSAEREERYIGHECGGIVVMPRTTLLDVPPDVRFAGWGQEDDSWAAALRSVHGDPWRGTADLIHLWHPPQERIDRRTGSAEGRELFKRYAFARRVGPERTRMLIDEGRALWPQEVPAWTRAGSSAPSAP